MARRGFLIAWVAFLLGLGLLAAWSTLGPALQNKNQASNEYKKSLSIPDQGPVGKVRVRVGMSLEKISDFSIKNTAWNADFYVWFEWKEPPDDSSFDPGETFEIVNGTIENKQKIVEQFNGDSHYALYRVLASITYPFKVTRYPADDHLLNIFIQDPVHPQIQYVADRENSRLAPGIVIPGYRIARTVVGVRINSENTTLGNPTGSKDVAQFGFGIFIYRPGLGIYFKLFQALFAAVGIALLAVFFKPDNSTRFDLLIGGMFAAVANSYITSSYLPDTGVMTLMDQINGLGLATILLCMVETVISARFTSGKEEAFSRLFDRISFGLIFLIYLALNIALPLVALNY
jgi:hypothetical protein